MSKENAGNIYKKITLILKEIGAIDKGQKNTMQGYMYRGIDDFLNALHPLLAKHEVFLNPRVIENISEIREVIRGNGKKGVDKYVTLKVEYDFISSDGSSFTVGAVYGEAIDSSDKATNKAMSAALKYALTQMFAVPTQDTVDADSETIPIQAKAEKPKPVKKVEAKPLEKKEISVDPNKVVTEKQVTRLFTIAGDCGWSNDELRHFLQEQYNKTTTRALVQSEYNEFISFIQESKKKEDDVAWDAGLTT